MNRNKRLRVCLGAALIVFSAVAAADGPSYVGAKKCRVCHPKQFKSWSGTNMAKAFELLKPGVRPDAKKAAGLDPAADYTADPECLGCHTTGYGKPGGFVSVDETPLLVGVQCEACHGPGSEYLSAGKMTMKNKSFKRDEVVAAGLVIPSQETCVGACHNEKSPFAGKSAGFNFEERKSKGTHEHIALKYEH